MCDSPQKLNSGIYKILNKVNGKYYIGSAVNFITRWQAHRWHLNNNSHHNKHLQSAWNKYWSVSFEFVILEYVKVLEDLEQIEQIYLNGLDEKITYNICKIAGTKLNVPMLQETKNKISISNKGHTHGMTGKNHSNETREKQSNSQLGITNRNIIKWPCPRGYYCDCDICKPKRNEQIRISSYKRKFG